MTQPTNLGNNNLRETLSSRAMTTTPFSISSLLTAAGTFVAGSAIFFYIGLEVGKAELKTREDLKSMDLPAISRDARQATEALKSASVEFKELLSNNASYIKLKSEVDAQKARIAELSNALELRQVQIDDQRTALEAAAKEIKSLRPSGTEIIVAQGSSEPVTNDLLVGVTLMYVTSADININGRVLTRRAGDIWTETAGSTECRIKLISFLPNNSVKFVVDCPAS